MAGSDDATTMEGGRIDQDGFVDRSQRFSDLPACETARRIAGEPALLSAASAHLERFARDDPRQRRGYALWRALLDGPCDAVVALLTARSAAGDYVRETAPAFPGLPVATRTRLLRIARSPLVEAVPP